MDKPAVIKARTPGNHWGYDRVESLARISEGYKRCRKRQNFIPVETAFDNGVETCSHCKQPVTPEDAHKPTVAEYEAGAKSSRGVRGVYFPKEKGYVVYHYDCGWDALLRDIILRDCVRTESI